MKQLRKLRIRILLTCTTHFHENSTLRSEAFIGTPLFVGLSKRSAKKGWELFTSEVAAHNLCTIVLPDELYPLPNVPNEQVFRITPI